MAPKTQPIESPLVEMETILNRFERTLDEAVHGAYQEAVAEDRKAALQAKIQQQKKEGKATFFTSWTNRKYSSMSAETPSLLPRSERSKRTLPNVPNTQVFFLETLPVDQLVEDLRRLAELVIIGENYVTTQEKKRLQKLERIREQWNTQRDSIEGDVDCPADEEEPDEAETLPERAELFDLFFERHALETIVHLLTGSALDLVDHVEHLKQMQVLRGGNDDDPENLDSATTIFDLKEEVRNRILLPPIAVATQAIQSISILIQNVSRATSLYIILSNDHMNTLIDLSLERYSAAESRRRAAVGDESRAIFASPEMSELTTHFVTLLKSLALRMNAETLQFFLKYPVEGEQGIPVSSPHYSPSRSRRLKSGIYGSQECIPLSDPDGSRSGSGIYSSQEFENDLHTEGTEQALQVVFPLYQRALDFCAAHQENFVRVTAMNICLNTLRLTTIEPETEAATTASPDQDAEEEGAFGSAVTSPSPASERSMMSPDGVLHTAQALPFRERLAIARFTCIPSRVERLIAPIFTKLSERWTALDEATRAMDENRGNVTGWDKVSLAKEKVRRDRLVRAFLDKAADLQDELMLLEDVFKVGLTVLNEQLIEMMLATFVYPMLCQPLLNLFQRFANKMDIPRMSTHTHPFGGWEGDYSDIYSLLMPFSGPAKTALFTIASVFYSLSNQQLLRLLYTALFHPLSPDSTSVPTVRSNLVVSITDHRGKPTIRLDPLPQTEGPVPNERCTYPFGTTPNNRRLSAMQSPNLSELEDKEVCVFVLAPALAEVLEFNGLDMGLLARSKPNSYREAIFQCFDMPYEFAEIRALAACAIDAAVSVFDAKFAADVMLGTDMKTFTDDIPADERNLDSAEAYMADDRGLGGSATYESRQNITRQRGGNVGADLTAEFVAALSKGTIFASRDRHSGWKLDYDDIAAHSFLLIGKGNSRALLQSSKVLENRRRQAATFLAETPGSMFNPMGGSSALFPPGAPTANEEDYEEQLFGSIMNTVIFDRIGDAGLPVVENFLQLKNPAEQTTKEGFSVPISMRSSFNKLCKRIGTFLKATMEIDKEGEAADLAESRMSATQVMKLDALVSLLKDLAASGGLAIRDVNLQGIALSATGMFVNTMEHSMSEQIYAPVSNSLGSVLMDPAREVTLPTNGTILALAGKKAIPCVCEAPSELAHLFLDANTGVQAEGVTWQSLYLVFDGDMLILAQVLPDGSAGDGRVISACYTEYLSIGEDTSGALNPSAARRLFVSHTGWDTAAPPLFLFDDPPPPRATVGPFEKVQPYTSRLDVWFEHQRAADLAYRILTTQVFQAKAMRGRRVQAFLDPQGHYFD